MALHFLPRWEAHVSAVQHEADRAGAQHGEPRPGGLCPGHGLGASSLLPEGSSAGVVLGTEEAEAALRG